MCVINRDCKVAPIKQFYKALNEESNIVQYIGIAQDEPKRLERLKENQISLLDKYEYTEKMAFDLCKQNGLISPIYNSSSRGGCWFCPNAKYTAFQELRRNHKDLWDKLIELSHTPNLCSYGFKYGKTVQEVDEILNNMDAQLKLF